MRKLILSLLCILGIYTAHAQQDAQFSQYMFNGIYINPAYAGYREVWNMHACYRKQWVNFPGAPQTVSFAVDGIANDNRVGLALQVINDKIGITNSTSIYANYAYRIPMNYDRTRTLAFGLGAGIVQNSIDIDKLDPDQTIDPTLNVLNSSKLLPDARFGIFYNSERFYIGASTDRLITNFWKLKSSSEEAYMDFKLHWYLTSGCLIHLSDNYELKPSFLIKDDINGPTSIDLNAFVLIYDKLWLGASYRTAVNLYNKPNLRSNLTKPADFVGMIDIFLGKKIRLGYAYDYSLNAKTTQNYSTHELSIGYFFIPADRAMLTPRYF